MTTLLIDAGNTRIKWCLHDAASPWPAADAVGTQRGAAPLEEIAALAQAWSTLDCRQALLACVADDRIHAQVSAALARRAHVVPLTRIVPRRSACGIANAYRDTTQLGADRWAAALGAEDAFPGRMLVVVSLGTATTIDLVRPLATGPQTERARFEGGVILPGIELMRAALARGTARLPLAQGSYTAIADNTDDAIVSGILHAQAGAIERICAHATQIGAPVATPHGGQSALGPPLCLVGGGAAAPVLPLLAQRTGQFDVQAADDLVLRGLARLARETPA